MMDFFIPSVLLVTISWVSFWLQADNAAPRITIGTSTMLSFITLASSQSRTLPKVSYIKASEIWFLGCTLFIFGSLAEFAFVNIIWRRKSNIQLKKVNSKYVLKSTITPRLARKQLQRRALGIRKSSSCSNIDEFRHSNNKISTNYLTIHSYPSTSEMTLPTIITENETLDKNMFPESIVIPISQQTDSSLSNFGLTTMTPQEIAQWIDKRSRICFPIGFVIFNIFYWTFVYCF